MISIQKCSPNTPINYGAFVFVVPLMTSLMSNPASWAQSVIEESIDNLSANRRIAFNRENMTSKEFFTHSRRLASNAADVDSHFDKVWGPSKLKGSHGSGSTTPVYMRGKYKVLQAVSNSMSVGDIVVIASPHHRYVLVYAGEHRFKNSGKSYSFFIYPFLERTGLELNTFPPRFYLSMFQKYGIVVEDNDDPSGFNMKRSKRGVRTELASYSFGSLSSMSMRLWIKSPPPVIYPMAWWKKERFEVSVYRTQLKSVDCFVSGVFHLEQPTSMTCWATVTTMLVNWRTQQSRSIGDVMASIGPSYQKMFDLNVGLRASEKDRFLADAGFQLEYPQSLSAQGWEKLLKTHGPLWVTTDVNLSKKGGIHARILYGIKGDGSADRTKMYFHDPAKKPPPKGKRRWESLKLFIKRFEQEVAAGGKARIQIVHY